MGHHQRAKIVGGQRTSVRVTHLLLMPHHIKNGGQHLKRLIMKIKARTCCLEKYRNVLSGSASPESDVPLVKAEIHLDHSHTTEKELVQETLGG